VTSRVKLYQLLLLGGDLVILYGSLVAMLFLRYGDISPEIRSSHPWPFTALFIAWVFVFYLFGLYDTRTLSADRSLAKVFLAATSVNASTAIAFFYFLADIRVAPKTNLFILLALSIPLLYTWRIAYIGIVGRRGFTRNILVAGSTPAATHIVEHLRRYPGAGYTVTHWIKNETLDADLDNLGEIIRAHRIDAIVIPAHLKKDSAAARKIYRHLILGIEVLDLAALYEAVFDKVPLVELEEVWFLENVTRGHPIYDVLKRPAEVTIALSLSILLLPLALFIVLAIKLTSPGSAFFTQTRVGKKGKRFVLWKFRTMVRDAEREGPQWATPHDKRITFLGRLLRATHIDELPQLWNILAGDLSLVGPRPERPEFTATLERQIPYYALRHLVRPGLTGWAQVSYRYGASIEETYEKLQYDIFYLKHRSILFDLLILMKTAKRLFIPA
jgi:exopolysaccharide biosynthesis polyprenyl glycosylphosphotransferase